MLSLFKIPDADFTIIDLGNGEAWFQERDEEGRVFLEGPSPIEDVERGPIFARSIGGTAKVRRYTKAEVRGDKALQEKLWPHGISLVDWLSDAQ